MASTAPRMRCEWFERDAPAFSRTPGYRADRRIERHLFHGFAADRHLADPIGGRRRLHGRLLTAAERRRHGVSNGDRLAGIAAAAWNEHDVVALDRKLAGPFNDAALRVADVVQAGNEIDGADPLAGMHRQRTREYARHHLVALAVQARVDHPAVADVEKQQEAERDDTDHQRADRDGAARAAAARAT